MGPSPLTALAVVAALSGCSSKGDSGGEQPGDTALATQLWEFIQAESGSWASPEGWEGTQPINYRAESAHETHTVVKANPHAAATLGGDIVEGAILVSWDYRDGELIQISGMKKIPDYAPDDGDWFWARWAPIGNVRDAGAIGWCQNCHQGGVDFAWTGWISSGEGEDTAR